MIMTLFSLLCKTPKWGIRIIVSIMSHFQLNPINFVFFLLGVLAFRCLIQGKRFVILTAILAYSAWLFQDHVILFPERFVQHLEGDCDGMTILPKGQGTLHARNGSFPMLFFHGRGGTAGLFEGLYTDLARSVGASAWIAEYRGYGCCRGWLPREGLCEDAREILHYVSSNEQSKVLVHGGSMGAASAACLLASQKTRDLVAGIILDDPWTTWPDAVKSNLPSVLSWLPIEYLMVSKYDTLSAVGKAGSIPLLVLSSEHDQLLPHSMREEIFAASSSDTKYLVSAPGGHGAVIGGVGVQEAYRLFCREVMDKFGVGLPSNQSE